MKQSTKKWTLGSAALLSIGCVALAGALVTKPVAALAAEAEKSYYYYVNVGKAEFTEKDGQLNLGAGSLQEGGAADQEKDDSNTWGHTIEGESTIYTFTMSEAGSYQLALLVEGTGTLAINSEGEEPEEPDPTDPEGGETEESGDPETQAEEEGKRVLSQTVTTNEDLTIIVKTTGYTLHSLMVAPEDSDIILDATWSNEKTGKVIVYGELLEKETAVEGFTSSGKNYAPVDYSDLPGGGGANLNFNGFEASGVIRGTDIAISRYFAVMPKSLVYFVNAASATGVASSAWQYADADENDQFYDYNTLVHNFYKANGSTLKNDGLADQRWTSGKTWGYTTPSIRGVRRTAAYAFPFNTIRWSSQGVSVKGEGTAGLNVGYKLGGLEAGKEYIVYIGTKSFWHDRTCVLEFNGASAGNLTVTASREVATYRVAADGNGMIEMLLKGPANQDEACVAFVAVQEVADAPEDAPAANITSDAKTVDIDGTQIEIKDVQIGAKLQIYNEARPYNVLYEEIADEKNLDENGVYTLNYKKPFTGITRFTIVQMTNGGVSTGPSIAVTDIKDFKIDYDKSYTSQNIKLNVSAKATNGIVKCTVQKDYDPIQTFELYRVGEMNLEYIVRENGTYKFVVYSGIDGVTYSENLVINQIDKSAPVLTLAPTGSGWDGTTYTVRATINSVAPVASYTVYKDGVEIQKGETLPSRFSFTEKGEYEISVVTAANARATSSVLIGDAPVYTKVTKQLMGSDITFNFEAIDGYEMESLYVYQIADGSASRLTVIGGKELTVYDPGTYVAVVKTKAGTTEMYQFNVTRNDFQTGGKPSYIGTIVAGALAGAAVIGIVVTVVVLKKKKS